MARLLSLFIIFSGIISGFQALAWPPTYGAEFELTHPSLVSRWEAGGKAEAEQAKQIYIENIRRICDLRGCKVEAVPGKWLTSDFRVTMPDGWWFKVSHDPGCVEITTKPSALSELRRQAPVINSVVFESGMASGFHVENFRNAHFNFGALASFSGHTEAFLRFFVDLHNRPDIILGGLGFEDLGNSPPLSIHEQSQRDALKKIIDDFYAGKFASIGQLAESITKRVYTKSHIKEWGAPFHYQAVGLKYVTESNLRSQDRPIELRAIRGQRSAEDFIMVAELIEARIKYMKSLKGPIFYNNTDRKLFSPIEFRTRFYIFVSESGLDFERYRPLLGEYKNGELADFLNPKTSIKRRLSSLLDYADLIPLSPWLQKYAHQLLADPQASGARHYSEVLKLLPALAPVRACHSIFAS